MTVEAKVQAVINKVNSGKLNKLFSQLDGSDFGVYVPVYDDGGTIKMMLEGYSQIERDLVISVSPNVVDPDEVIPNIVNPDGISPNVVDPDEVIPNVVNPDVVNPDGISPNVVDPDEVIPNIVNPDVVNPDGINPNVVEDDALPIGWFGRINGKDSSCRHGGEDRCRHCTSHTDQCRHCTHPNDSTSNSLDAPELDYHSTVNEINSKHELLDMLAPEGLGLTLIHGHSNKHMFTKLPSEYISVIAGGKTAFRLANDVAKDPTFVPNVWRTINGELKVAGGHSQMTDI